MGLFNFILTPYAIPIALIFYYLVPYFGSNSHLRRYPGPFLARFSNLWLFWQARQGRRFLSVDKSHKEHGKFVRIQPQHISIADETAFPAIYGPGNGLLKDEYYRAFSSGYLNIFNMRDRREHAQRRKITSHIYSSKSISQFELYLRQNIELFAQKWDNLVSEVGNSYAKLDCQHWFSLLSFDVIGDLAFGQPFGLLEKGDDIVELRKTPSADPVYVRAVQSLHQGGRASATLGCIASVVPFVKYFPDPFCRNGINGVDNLVSLAVSKVTKRIEGKSDPDRTDILALLMQSKHESGAKLSPIELHSESLMLLFAGSETITNTTCSIIYYILHTPFVLRKLQAELDAALPNIAAVPTFEQVKTLPYLHNVINETLRVYSTTALGLPRVVPPGPGVDILGQHFPAGTVLSVPTHTIHHSPEIWGKDVEEFVPERWEHLTDRQRSAFNAFSYGTRSCIGRNLAIMELALFVATTIRRWDLKLYTEHLESTEGFSKRPIECFIGVKKRI